ncbi:MAG: hypothetical protein ACKVP3_11000 [Hyphomicrobiaceae bacterium]
MTAQIGDGLTIDREPAHLMGCPALPWHHSRLRKLSEAEALEVSKDNALIFSTACWRNYVAQWRVEDGRLYLDRITGIYALDGEEPLFADWVTETLRVARGERLAYVHMGFGSVFEEDVLLNRMGKVVGQTIRDNRGQAHDTASLGWENLPSDATVTPGRGGQRQ